MCVYETTKNSDGTLELAPGQISELKERGYTSELIYSRLLKLYEISKLIESGEIVSGPEDSMQPCSECGNNDFIRTGNCHACRTCGASQGCS